SHVRQLTRSVAANASAVHDARLQVEILRDCWQQHRATDTRPIGRFGIGGVERAARRYGAATERIVSKEPLDPEQLVMTPARVPGGLCDNVRCLIRRDVDAIQEAACANIGKVDENAIDGTWNVARSRERCGIFHRNAQPEAFAKILDEPELPISGIVEADGLVVIDYKRDVLLARDNSNLVLCQQTPRLASEEVGAPISV